MPRLSHEEIIAELDRLYHHSMIGAKEHWPRLGLDSYHLAVDYARKGGDATCYTLCKRPGKIRLFLRRWHIDRSTWEMKIIRQIIR